jgi:dTDP-4-dehydrorhamnose 3,5-epimerase
MRVVETDIVGLRIIEGLRHHDERGFFAKLFEAEALEGRGVRMPVAQVAISQNKRAGTVRGMHWQDEPLPDAKIVRPIRGRIFDVAADVREGSPTRGAWRGFVLDADEDRALLIGPGLAHGFQTLLGETEVLYLIDAPYRPELGRGARWDDPVLAIGWPEPVTVVSDRDRAFPALTR